MAQNSYTVTLHPKSGTGGGTIRVQVSAEFDTQAKRLAEAQYGDKYSVGQVLRS